MLACGGEWDDYLKHVAFVYNTSLQSSTNYTPYYLTHGQEGQVPVDVLLPSLMCSDLPSSYVDFVTSLAEKLERHIRQAQEKQKMYYDGAARDKPFVEGDLVWLHNPTEDHMKLSLNWKGPYRVLAVSCSQEEPGLTYVTSYYLSLGL